MFSYNRDAVEVPSYAASPGPRVGPLESFTQAYDLTIRDTDNSIKEQMDAAYKKQNDALREVGYDNAPALKTADPRAMARYFTNQDEDPDFDIREVDDYDTQITELKTKYPQLELRTSRELWKGVQDDYRKLAYDNDAQPRSFVGSVAGFGGSMAASLDPRYNPINAASVFLPVGKGVGLLGTLGRESLVNAGVEAVNEIGGAAQNREMLGGDGGLGSSIENIATAGAAGAVFRGAGEALMYGGRKLKGRWFADALDDPAPATPELKVDGPPTPEEIKLRQDMIAADIIPRRSTIGDRTMYARASEDFAYVESRLDAWDGELPGSIQPEMRFRMADDTVTRATLGGLSVDEMARQADPKTFRVYDTLAGRKVELRDAIDAARPDAVQQRLAVADIEEQIQSLETQLAVRGRGQLPARKRVSVQKDMEKLAKQRDATVKELQTKDTPEMADMRKALQDVDYKMRDMAEPVSRAYARARGEWALSKEYRDAVGGMTREGSVRLPDGKGAYTPAPLPERDSNSIASLTEKAPILRSAPLVQDKMKFGSTPMDYAHAIVKKEVEILDDVLESYRAGLESAVDKSQKEVTILNTGRKLHLDKEKIEMELEDGSTKVMSLRQILQENLDKEYELKAITTCST